MDEIIEKYIDMFGKLPPNDAVMSYYSNFYQDLMKKAIETKKEITPDVLDKEIGNKPYDYIITKKNQFSNFKKPIN